MAVFWIAAPCSLSEVFQRFRGPYCFHHHGALMMEAASISETSVTSTGIHGAATHRRDNLKSYQIKTYSR
jgi:hypothetical protein